MEKSELIYCRLIECVHKNEVKESEQIKIITDLAKYLGLKTLTNYAEQLVSIIRYR